MAGAPERESDRPGPQAGSSDAEFERRDRAQASKDRRRHHATIISAWRQQQAQDRAMRRTYARWLMTVLSIQLVVIHVIFALIGYGVLKFEAWTANVFITAVFAEN